MPTLARQPGIPLAYDFFSPTEEGPVLVFCPGYASDKEGSKALHLWAMAAAQKFAMLRFDYSGHGQSGGAFIEGSIGDWTQDAAFLIRELTGKRPLLLVGSSMGGWIALLLALRFSSRLAGLVLIAPAPDFTQELAASALTADQKAELARNGVLYPPSQYGAPIPLTRKLLEEGRDHLLLHAPIEIACPVRILHGMADPDVPWALSLRLTERLAAPDTRLTYIKDGDHRLSRPQDLLLLEETVKGFPGLSPLAGRPWPGAPDPLGP